MSDIIVDLDSLPEDVREKLAELDLELSEGDITQKGFEKKRARLLQPFIQKHAQVKEKKGMTEKNHQVKQQTQQISCDRGNNSQFLVQQKNIIKSSYKSQKFPEPSVQQNVQQQYNYHQQSTQNSSLKQSQNQISSSISNQSNIVPSHLLSSLNSNLVKSSSNNPTAPSAPAVNTQSDSNNTNLNTSGNNTNSSNQPSRNRRIGRHESRYTSGK